MSQPPIDRKALRQRLLAEREALPPELREQYTAAIARHLLTLLAQLAPRTLAFCWPYRGEADLRPALLAWQAADPLRQLALPVVPETAGPLTFHCWDPARPLALDRFGIPSPQTAPRCQPEVVLVPVNGFDARGYRLGYGGGFFDRTLAETAAPVSVGIGFELARLADVQPQAHDLPLDWIITEAGCVVCPPACKEKP